MGIDLGWCYDNRHVFETIGDPKRLFAQLLSHVDLSGTICLQFIDPYGETTFNSLQIPILIKELHWLHEVAVDPAA
jgi:hypothetical protein